ncbi:MAG: sensor histidine kinase [Ginsengibacter sp.]
MKTIRCLLMLLFLSGLFLHGISQHLLYYDSMTIINCKNRPEEVIHKLNLSKIHFAKALENRINFGLAGNEYKYILLKVKIAGEDADPYLSIDNTSLDTVSIYSIDEDGNAQQVYLAGALVPFNQDKEFVWHTVALNGHLSTFYLIALKSPQKNINVRYEILTRDELEQKYQSHDRIIFFYTGIVSLIVIVILLAFLLFQKAVFATYLGYILCAFIWIVSHYGYMFPYVYPQLPVINEIIKPVSSDGAGFFLLMVMSQVFRQQIESKRIFGKSINTTLHILPAVIASMFLLLIPNLHDMIRYFLMIGWHVALIITLCMIAIIPVCFIRTGPTAKIFSSAMFVICAMTMLQLLNNSGFINNFFVGEHGITLGSLLENIILAFGLFYNLLQERKQREEQVLALELEQAETLKKLITVQDNERKRIAGDLHDNIGPLLAALKINFRRIIHTKERGALNGLASKTELIIDESIAEIHNVALNLMPKGLSSNGLINTLQEYFDSIEQLYNKPIVFNHQVESILYPELQISLYRIICELALNAARHSDASNITVCIHANEKIVSLYIHDDGKGFQIKAAGNKKSLGLQNAESRVLYMKGTFDLQTQAGKGTQIQINIPFQSDNLYHVRQ